MLERSRDVRVHVLRAALRRLGENGEQPGARVLGVDVDRVRAERAERDLGGAEARPPLHAHAARLEQLGEHLGEQIGLTERLRRHDDGALAGLPRQRRSSRGDARAGDEREHRHEAPHESLTPARASSDAT